VTSVYVTHDQVEAMTLADVLVVLNAGVAEQIDAPMAIYERPATIFVASFIGSPAMNMVTVKSAGAKGFELLGGGFVKPRELRVPEQGGDMVLGIRPEHLTLVADGNEDIALHVTAVETLGADTLAHGRISAAEVKGGEIIARLPGGVRVKEGDQLPLAIAPGMAHLFDAGTGRRI
jgi:sn-glycerol 3-phosphate transport system ATP-binding protein